MPFDTDVIVVGAGPVGLALAIELGMRGVSVLLVERNPRGGTAPRAKTTNVRTRTHLRRWGLADRLAQASPMGVDYPNDVMFVTRLSKHLLAHFKNAFNGYPERSNDYPEHAQWVPQYTLERIMLEHVRTLPSVEVRFGASLTGANAGHRWCDRSASGGNGSADPGQRPLSRRRRWRPKHSAGARRRENGGQVRSLAQL